MFDRRVFVVGSLSALAFLTGCEQEKFAVAAPRLTEEQFAFSEGDRNAPLVMQEFISLTCGFCARFHRESYPALKEKLIDTGQLLLVYRSFPLDGMALRGSMLARSMPPELGVKFIKVLLEYQPRWVNREGDLEGLANFARLAGLSPEQIGEAFANEELLDSIVLERQEATAQYNITGTPTFVIGDDKYEGESFEGLVDWSRSYL